MAGKQVKRAPDLDESPPRRTLLTFAKLITPSLGLLRPWGGGFLSIWFFVLMLF